MFRLSKSGANTIIQKMDTNAINGWWYGIDGNGNPCFYYANNGVTRTFPNTLYSSDLVDVTASIVYTYNTTDVVCYVNGAVSQAWHGNYPLIGNGTTLPVVKVGDNTTNCFAGTMYYIKLYNYVQTPAQVAANYTANTWRTATAVQPDQSSYTVAENAGKVTVKIVAVGYSDVAYSVDYATANGTALSWVNYTATSGRLNFTTTNNTQYLDVPILNRPGAGANTFFFVNLSNPVNCTIAVSNTTIVVTPEIDAPPTAYFVSDVQNGMAPLAVQFTDQSGGWPDTWSWDFGDGSANSTAQNPSYTYNVPGAYNVSLTVSNANGTATTQRLSYIVAWSNATSARFTVTPRSGYAPLSVQFTDQSVNATTWRWTFGDGAQDSIQNPVHVYTIPGTYSVSLNVTNPYSSDTRTMNAYITVLPAPFTAVFTTDVSSGTYPLTVHFTDHTENATEWQWNFGDGSGSTLQNPTHTYNSPGTFTVTLTANNPYFTDTATGTIIVGQQDLGKAFTANVTDAYVPMTVKFTDLTGNATSWQWDFGDSTANSTLQNPTHTYTVPGTYTVTLTASNAYGSGTTMRYHYITVRNAVVVADFTNSPETSTSGAVPLTVQFEDLSTNADLNSSGSRP
jgi:PKD repeat protein